ncbi:MAG: dipeptidase [Candidatus Aminicenantes bacterium]|nr:MAG: dipeptidase [Candidatus Aminicenantes bacterium]
MAIVFDAHSDILNDIHPRRLLGEKEVIEKFWAPKMRKGKIDIRVVAIYSDIQYLPELALRRGLDLIATLYEEIEESPSSMLCTTYADIKKAKDTGKIGFVLGMEGAEPLGSDIQVLRIFYKLGLRVLGLTHALRTYLADGSFLSPKKAGQIGGLTDVGVAFLEQAQDMGIIIDVSHLNDPSFWDVIKFVQVPIIASHSNCRKLRDHPRNLTDEQIKAVADTGGVIGVNACGLFVQPPDLNHLMDHIEYLVKIGGVEHTGLGPDFADYLLEYMTEKERARIPDEWIRPVDGFSGDEEFSKIADELAKRGYKTSDIDLIMGENFARVFRDVLKP